MSRRLAVIFHQLYTYRPSALLVVIFQQMPLSRRCHTAISMTTTGAAMLRCEMSSDLLIAGNVDLTGANKRSAFPPQLSRVFASLVHS